MFSPVGGFPATPLDDLAQLEKFPEFVAKTKREAELKDVKEKEILYLSGDVPLSV